MEGYFKTGNVPEYNERHMPRRNYRSDIHDDSRKKNPSRSISSDRRVVADLRRVNIRCDTKQYYPAVVPKIYEIARRIVSLVWKYPGLSLRMTKRALASAFRLLRFRPSLEMVMVTEFPADHVCLEMDLVCFYLVMSFGGMDHQPTSPDLAMRLQKHIGVVV